MLSERTMWLKPLSSPCLYRTQLRGLGRTQLWRSCTCSVRRAVVWTTGFPRSASPGVDLGLGSSLCSDAVKLLNLEILILMNRMTLFLLIPGYSWGGFTSRQHGAGPRGRPWHRRLLSRPCQDDSHSLCEWGQVCHKSDTSTLILCADEVWRGRRSEFCVLWFHRANVASWSTRSRRRSGAEEEAFLKRDFLKMSSLLSNMTTVAVSENVSHFPELS